MTRKLLIGVLLIMMGGCSTAPTSFTPSDPLPSEQVSHRLWQELLSADVRDGVVDYPAIRRQGRLPSYIALLNRVDPGRLSVGDRLAFWINAYNAFAVTGILDGYSPDTLFGRYRYFIARKYSIGGQAVNLYDLEREILIAQFHEPRVHFAIVCASASCPKLQSWAFEGQHLDEQLNRVTEEFVNDPLRNRFDRSRKVASLSMIFKWFAKDFEARSGSILGYVGEYVQDPSLKQALLAGDYTVEFLDYDWHLNGPSP
ncbi:MAG: DUF547 domain-containing protein [Nitrospira sp. CR1.1]|nr:DUF547 domain-containing protein [Nitrospira sp. CR1.1]